MSGSTRGVKLHGRTRLGSWEVCGLSASPSERSAKFASGFPGPLRERLLTRGTRLKPQEAVLPELYPENRTRLLDSFRRLVRSALRLVPTARIPEFPWLHCRLLGKSKRQQDLRRRLVRSAPRPCPAERVPEFSTLHSPLLGKWRQKDLRRSPVGRALRFFPVEF